MTLYGKIKIKNPTYDYFETKGILENNTVLLNLRAPKNFIYTKSLPKINSHLEVLLPGIFTSQCFNKNKYKFKKECENTELGHLFEHVLLEYLCLEKISKGEKKYCFRGLTTWNWKMEERGKFKIKIEYLYPHEEDILQKAFIKSLQLFENLLDGYLTTEQDLLTYSVATN